MLQLALAPLYHFPHICDLRVTKTGRVLFRLPDTDKLSEVQFPLTDVIALTWVDGQTLTLETAYAHYTLTTPDGMANAVFDVLRQTWHYFLGLYDHDEPEPADTVPAPGCDVGAVDDGLPDPAPEPEPLVPPRREPVFSHFTPVHLNLRPRR